MLLIEEACDAFLLRGEVPLFLSLSSVQMDLVLSQVLTLDRDEQSLN